jgi:hypothetical protein
MVRPSPRERRLRRAAAVDRYPGDPNCRAYTPGTHARKEEE